MRPLWRRSKHRVGLLVSLLFVLSLLASLPAQAAAWTTTIVDQTANVGWDSSIALDSTGKPHITYKDSTNQQQKYAVWNGTDWTVQSAFDVDASSVYASLALDANDRPHISFYNALAKDLNYALRDGGTWNIQTVDSAGDVGLYTSLALDSAGNPHISYIDNTNSTLKYAVWNGSSWTTETIDAQNLVSMETSLALDSHDIPHISYYAKPSRTLKHAVRQSSGWLSETVDNNGDVGAHSSLAIDSNDHPHISYIDNSNNSLKYAASDGSSWRLQTVDRGTHVGLFSSLALNAQDSPRISYYDLIDGDLMYAAWSGSMWVTQSADQNQNTGQYTSLALDAEGTPHISYMNISSYQLMYATLADATAPTTVARANDGNYTFASWTNKSVSVTLSASDGIGSGVANTFSTINGGSQQTYSVPIMLSTEGSHTFSYWSVDNAGNAETSKSATVNIDLTAPTISGAPGPSSNVHGWHNDTVTVSWTCADTGGSGLFSCPEDVTIDSEGSGQSITRTIMDHAGNTAVATSEPVVHLDRTVPAIAYSGQRASYRVDELVSITCVATDSLSGIDSTTCTDISGPAASFTPGLNHFSATAIDRAGNIAHATVNVTVNVTAESLCTLTRQYTGNARSGSQLCAPLQLVTLAEQTRNPRMKTSAINSYTLLVTTERGRSLTSQQAATLIRLAQSL